jgi:isopentenyldiphosphate isomerase
MNMVVVVNEADEVVGTMPEEEAHKDGTSHRITVIYVENEGGDMLVQVRTTGAHDHSCAGHVDPDESYLDAATRELAEELGISGAVLIRIGHGVSRERRDTTSFKTHVFDVFWCKATYGQLQPEEVQEVYWADPEEIMNLMVTGATEITYAGGFRASLPIYLDWRRSRASNRPA